MENEYVWVAYFRREETALLQSVRKKLCASVEGEEAGRMNQPLTLRSSAAHVSSAMVSSLAQVVSVGRWSAFAAWPLLSKGGFR